MLKVFIEANNETSNAGCNPQSGAAQSQYVTPLPGDSDSTMYACCLVKAYDCLHLHTQSFPSSLSHCPGSRPTVALVRSDTRRRLWPLHKNRSSLLIILRSYIDKTSCRMTQITKPESDSDTPLDSTMDDFVDVGAEGSIPHRPKPHQNDNINLQIHPLASNNGESVLISIQPPKAPQDELPHVPVDIVLVIDISISMSWSAPLPDTQDRIERESTGLSVLDLTKHAVKTVLAPLNEHDRLALVVFSHDGRIVQDLSYMTKSGKQQMLTKLEALTPEPYTNLWGGIKTGLKVFENATNINNVQGMFVLTDGMPNHMCPPQGYVTKLKPMLADMAASKPQVPTIHTFGFGYDMKSDLMQSIAEVGNGNYAFIPDAGMIGTIFVHAMANLCSTYCTEAELEIKVVDAGMISCPSALNLERPNSGTMILRLGNIQYGQSRDIVIISQRRSTTSASIKSASLKYKARIESGAFGNSKVITVVPEGASQAVDTSLGDYHRFRSQLCAFLAAFFPLQANGEHKALSHDKNSFDFEHARSQLDALVMHIKSSPHVDDLNVQSLLSDLVGDDQAGQITKAVSTNGTVNFYRRWGRHYLPSLLHAHARQVCNSFKDPGPLQYGIESPLFIKCRDEMDKAFESLPPPKPSRPPQRQTNGTYGYNKISMGRHHLSSNPCFEGQCEVLMGDRTNMPVNKLRPGLEVWTSKGSRKVVAVVKTSPKPKSKDQLCRVGNLWVTPYHPIQHNGQWVFPADVAAESKLCRTAVYSVLLAHSAHPEAHAINVGGVTGVTLGHGIRQAESDVRAHAFFGRYTKVVQSLMKLPKDSNGQLVSAGVERHPVTGLVCGFKAKEMKESVIRARTRKCAVASARYSARYALRPKTSVTAAA